MKILLAQPRGFCAGVDRAITIVDKALKLYGKPVYVRHEIVHNKYVVDSLRNKGAIFVKEIDEIPDGAITIFSAHGVSEKVEQNAKDRNLPFIDATCPLVKKVHISAIKQDKKGNEVILIGHEGHPEVEGTSGRVQNGVILVSSEEEVESINVKDENKLTYVTQTTLSVNDTKNIISALKKRFPHIEGPELKDICYATQNRQDAISDIVDHIDILLVVGAQNSSNSNRLRDLGEEENTKSFLINDASHIDNSWFDDVESIGITAGASAPEILVEEVIEYLKSNFDIEKVINFDGKEENVKFKLPKEVLKKVNY